jgi:hypothetical protein
MGYRITHFCHCSRSKNSAPNALRRRILRRDSPLEFDSGQ